MLAIVTGTISPAPQMSQLVLRDVEERLKQYEESLHFLLCSQAFTKVVFCENSNFGTEKISYLKDIAEKTVWSWNCCLSGEMWKRLAFMAKVMGKGKSWIMSFPTVTDQNRNLFCKTDRKT